MICPICGSRIPRRWLWRITRYSFIKCPQCNNEVGRLGGVAFLAIALATSAGPIAAFEVADNGYLSWPIAVVAAILWFIAWYFIDAGTVKLVPAAQVVVRPPSPVTSFLLLAWVGLGAISCLLLGFVFRYSASELIAGRFSMLAEASLIIAVLLAITSPTAGIVAFVRLPRFRTAVLVAVLAWAVGIAIIFWLFAKP